MEILKYCFNLNKNFLETIYYYTKQSNNQYFNIDTLDINNNIKIIINDILYELDDTYNIPVLTSLCKLNNIIIKYILISKINASLYGVKLIDSLINVLYYLKSELNNHIEYSNITNINKLNKFISNILSLKITICLIFELTYFLRSNIIISNFFKLDRGEDLEELIYYFIKLYNNNNFIPLNCLLCMYYIYLNITLNLNKKQTEEVNNISQSTCSVDYINHEINLISKYKMTPLYFIDYKKADNYIEHIFRKNFIRVNKFDDKLLMSSILTLLLSLCENISQLINYYSNNNCDFNSSSIVYNKEINNEIILDLIFIQYIKENNILDYNYNINTKIVDYNSYNEFLNDINNYVNKILNYNSDNFLNINNSIILYQIIDFYNKYITCGIILFIYWKIYNCIKLSNLIKFVWITNSLAEINGILVFLKLLNLDFKYLQIILQKYYNNNLSNTKSNNNNHNYLLFLLHIINNIDFNFITDNIIMYNIKFIYLLTEGNDDLTFKYLFECKIYIILKKFMNYHNFEIKKYSLELLKNQFKFFDKNLKHENMNILASIYLHLPYNLSFNKTINTVSYQVSNIQKMNSRQIFNSNKKLNDIYNFIKFQKRNVLCFEKFEKQNNEILSKKDIFKTLLNDYININYMIYYNNYDKEKKYYSNLKGSYYSKIYLNIYNRIDKKC